MKYLRRTLTLFLVTLFSGYAAVSFADEVATAGRAILEKNKKAVVTVRLVIKMQYSMPGMGSQQQESTSEVTGTVIDATGLTLVSLSATDPMSLYANFMPGEEEGGPKMESTVSDVKILGDDGSETPAKIVLRDKDLDMAFVRPQPKPGTQYPFVDFAQPSKPELLDEVIVLNRLGKVAGRAYGASAHRIVSIMEKPRTLYIPGESESMGNVGLPTFSLDGKVIGVTLLRSVKSSGGGGMMGMNPENAPISVILPASDIMDAAKQAPSYESAPEPKPLSSEGSAGAAEAEASAMPSPALPKSSE